MVTILLKHVNPAQVLCFVKRVLIMKPVIHVLMGTNIIWIYLFAKLKKKFKNKKHHLL